MKALALLALLLWQGSAADRPPAAQPDGLRYERAIRVAGDERSGSAGLGSERLDGERLGDAGSGDERLGDERLGDERLGGAGQACAVLDARIFARAAPSLIDLRIYPARAAPGGGAGGPDATHPVPYAITLSEAASEQTQPARVLNLGMGSGGTSHSIVFDLQMPARAYTGVTLDLDPAAHDFIATATVFGSDSLGGVKRSALGVFTLFDLTSQHLSRDTTIPLEESKYKYLHVRLSVSPAPGNSTSPGISPALGSRRRSGMTSAARFVPAMVLGAEVPPSREAQTVYTTVAQTATAANVGGETVAAFTMPARVPVERVSFMLMPGFRGNFSRAVRVTAQAETMGTGQPGPSAINGQGEDNIANGEDKRAPLVEVVTGSILRVHAYEAGREIDIEELAVPAVLGSNLQQAAKVEVAIENGDQPPLPIAGVRLEMRQRKICFEVPAGVATGREPGLALFYGDPELAAPEYEYAQRFVESGRPLVAELGPERPNPNYRAQAAEARPFEERHPESFWIVLIVAICALGVVALKAARNVGPR